MRVRFFFQTIALFAAFFMPVVQAKAAEPNPASSLVSKQDSKKPIEINADNLTVHQKDHIAIFTGNVEAVQGSVNLRSNEMIVYYRQAEAKKTPEAKAPAASTGLPGAQGGISRIDVNQNVYLSTPEETAQGSKGVYDVDKQEITLTGDVVITKGKNVLKGTRLVYNLNTGMSDMHSEAIGNEPKKRVRGIFVPENNDSKAAAKPQAVTKSSSKTAQAGNETPQNASQPPVPAPNNQGDNPAKSE